MTAGSTSLITILEIIAPVFGMIAFGYGATFTKVFDDDAARALATFVFYFAIPVLLFRSMANAELPETFAWGYIFAFYTGTVIVFALGIRLSEFLLGSPPKARALHGLGCTFGNTVLLGIPIVLTSFGEEAALPLFLLLAFHSTILYTSVTLLLEADTATLRELPRKTLQSLATNPILAGLVLGIAYNLAGLGIPGPVDRWMDLVSAAAIPCALFSMGASLRAYRIMGALRPATLMITMKMVAHPIIVWLLATRVFEMPLLWTKVAVVIAALPVGINVYLFGVRYNVAQAEGATAVLISTTLSVVWTALVLYLLGVDPKAAEMTPAS